jgi:hypothetical protein
MGRSTSSPGLCTGSPRRPRRGPTAPGSDAAQTPSRTGRDGDRVPGSPTVGRPPQRSPTVSGPRPAQRG